MICETKLRWFTCYICKRPRPAGAFVEINRKACVCKKCKTLEQNLFPRVYTYNSSLLYLLQVVKRIKGELE